MAQKKPTIIKYKIRHLFEGAQELEASSDEGIVECSNPTQVTSLISDRFNQGWTFVKKRAVGDWGWELFFRKRS